MTITHKNKDYWFESVILGAIKEIKTKGKTTVYTREQKDEVLKRFNNMELGWEYDGTYCYNITVENKSAMKKLNVDIDYIIGELKKLKDLIEKEKSSVLVKKQLDTTTRSFRQLNTFYKEYLFEGIVEEGGNKE